MVLKKPSHMIEFLLLHILSQKNSYGYEITKNIEKLSGNHWNVSHGTIYGALGRLEDNRYIKRSEKDEEDRKYFKITKKGKKQLKKHKSEINELKDRSQEIMLGFLNLYKNLHGTKDTEKLLKVIDNEFKTINIEVK